MLFAIDYCYCMDIRLCSFYLHGSKVLRCRRDLSRAVKDAIEVTQSERVTLKETESHRMLWIPTCENIDK